MSGQQFTYYLKGEDITKNVFFAGERPGIFSEGQKKCVNDYQYAYTDHLGNVRMIYTSEADSYTFKATMESEDSLKVDDALFVNIDDTRTYDPTGATSYDEVARLSSVRPIGPGISLPVYPGDTVDMQVKAYHYGGDFSGSLDVTQIVSALAGAFGGTSGGGTEQAIFDNAINPANGGFGLLGNGTSTRPAAYLNYILFDKNFKAVQHGHSQVSGSGSLETLSLNGIIAQKQGWVYVYLSNESNSADEVYFDDLEVTLKESLVVQSNNYYPFGLVTSDSWTRPTDLKNNFLYNAGSELNEETQNYETFYRQYDAAIGRFTAVDIMAGAFSSLTPYQYGNNNPVYYNDPNGDYGRGGSIYDEMKDRMGHKSTGPANDGFSGYSHGESFAQQFSARMAYRNDLYTRAQAGYADALQEYALMYGVGFSGSMDIFSATSMRSYHFGDGRLTGYTTYAYSNQGGYINHYRVGDPRGGFGSGLVDGFAGGLSSTWGFMKSLATVEGWKAVGQGFDDLATMACMTCPAGHAMKSQLANAAVNAVENVPNMSAYELGYATGYGVEKVAEAIALSKGAGAFKSGSSVTNISRSSLSPTHYITKSKTQMKVLMNDIRSNGIKTSIKYVDHNGAKLIVDGHHRFYAAQRLGIQNVPAQSVRLPYAGYKNTLDLVLEPGSNPGYWKYMK